MSYLHSQSLRPALFDQGYVDSRVPDSRQPCVDDYWRPGPAMEPAMAIIERIADSSVDVLFRGESGTGKEIIARDLHRRSRRRTQPFVKINCAALPADLLESELFGHERGAFTGANATRVGKFEFADGGTLMLDEIGELPVPLQAKLLHVLQDRQFTKVGSNRVLDTDVRIVAATNRDLESMMQEGRFREDLYYRLQVIEVHIPPLRLRREEIPSLVECFLHRYASLSRRDVRRPSRTLMDALVRHDWPGNIRELENTIKRFIVLQDEALVLSELSRQPDVPSTPTAVPQTAPPAIADVDVATSASDERHDLPTLAKAAALRAERSAIDHALIRFRWNRRKAAAYLRVSYKTLLTKMKECGITAPDR